MRQFTGFVVLICAVLVNTSRADIYELPPEGHDVIGAVSTIIARHEDTLIDIARRHGLGYQDIVRANPDVNVWVPGEGTEVILPTRFVLPAGTRDWRGAKSRRIPSLLFSQTERGRAGVRHDVPDQYRSYGLGNTAGPDQGHFQGSQPQLVCAAVGTRRTRGGR